MIPSLLEYDGCIAPCQGSCKFEQLSGQLFCNLATLDPLSKGGEEIAVRLSLHDQSQTLGAVKIKAILVASGIDGNAINDAQELAVTLGAGKFVPFSMPENTGKEEAPAGYSCHRRRSSSRRDHDF